MDKHSDEKPRVDTLEEEKNDQARVVATMSNDATENSDIVGVGGRASDGSKAAPVPGRGRRDIKKWKKARQEKAKRDRSRSRKEQRSRSDWSEDSYDEESDAIGKNFCPIWGLHNGAVGIVDEIVFKTGQNPNNRDLPDYVVVDVGRYTVCERNGSTLDPGAIYN